MPDQLKDIVVFLDETDTASNNALAGLGLCLARFHGARLTAVYSGAADQWDAFTSDATSDSDKSAFGGIHLSGIPHEPKGHRSRFSPLQELLLEASCDGHWISGKSLSEMLPELRCSDLIIMGQPGESRQSTVHVAPDAVISSAGRPVLVLPYTFSSEAVEDRHIGNRILIAWNGAAESSRATHDALPFLRRASNVVVFGAGGHSERIIARMVDHLNRHGVKARCDISSGNSEISISDLILNRASDLACDLIVAGAYHHSPLHERWLGGTSIELLRHMTVPVFTSH